MFKRKRALLPLLLLMGVAALAACTQEPEIIREEVVVTQIVVEEREVVVEGTPQIVVEEKIVEVTVAPNAATPANFGTFPALRVAMLQDITTTNIWNHLGPGGTEYNSYVLDYYPALFKYTPRNQWVPSLAADFPSEVTQDGDRWVSTVTLRDDVEWNDGTPVTASDVAFTVEVVLALRLLNNWQEFYDSTYLVGVEVVDDFTATFVYSQPPGVAAHQFGALLGPVVPAHYWQPKIAGLLDAAATLDSDASNAAILIDDLRQQLYTADTTDEPSAGPFQLAQWEVGDFIINEANPNYSFAGETTTLFANGAYQLTKADGSTFVAFGEAEGAVSAEYTEGPYAASVIYTIMDADAAQAALVAGDVDLIYGLNLEPDTIETLQQQNPALQSLAHPANGFRYIGFNFAKTPLDDVAVRKAIDCLIDKELLARDVLHGEVIPVDSPVPPANAAWHNPDVTVQCVGMTPPERFAEAVAILKEAGYSWEAEPAWNEARGGSVDRGSVLLLPNGAEFPEMTVLAPSPNEYFRRAVAGLFVAQYMQDLGMPVTAELTNFNNIFNAVFAGGDWDIFVMGWGLTPFADYLCKFFASGQDENILNYANRQVDEACAALETAASIEEARQLLFNLQEILVTDLPYIYLFSDVERDVYNGDTIMYGYTSALNRLTGTQQSLIKGVGASE